MTDEPTATGARRRRAEPRRVRRRSFALATLLALVTQLAGGFGGPPPARADTLGDVSVRAGQTVLAQLCALLPLTPTACAGLTDGRVIAESEVAAFERSWVWRALRAQDRLDDGEPLRNTLWAHTHNSFNSTAYLPSISSIDPNQRYSVLDQLRMGIRAIELDAHRFAGGVVLCHGETIDLGLFAVHLGCSLDRPLVAGLRELRDFLRLPGNEDEVVLLYLENNLDGDATAHAQAADAVASTLGPLVYRPPAGEPCADLPMDLTTDAVRAAGARVLIVGNCGPGAWGRWVHERGPAWDESGRGGAYPAYPACIEAERARERYDERWIRIWEDSTWLSALAYGPGVPLDAATVREMVRCGVDMIGFDRIEPFDGRLEALIWSWAPGEPAGDPARRCAGSDADGRFRTAPCDEPRRYACRTAGGDWVVPAASGPAAGAAAACQNAGATPATPPTGWENERLRAAAGTDPVWLPLRPG